jgi:hypothetical protein
MRSSYQSLKSLKSIDTINLSVSGVKLPARIYARLVVGSFIPSTSMKFETYCVAAKPPDALTW